MTCVIILLVRYQFATKHEITNQGFGVRMGLTKQKYMFSG